MSFARESGAEAAAMGLTASACPYAGHNPGSERLRRRWMDGYESEMRRRIRELEASRIYRRRSTIRSPYAKRRLSEIALENPNA